MRPPGGRGLTAALAAYLILLGRITLWPSLDGTPGPRILHRLADALAGVGLPLGFSDLEAAANVLLFVPFGLLAGLLVGPRGRRRVWFVVPAGLALSGAIELTQLAFLPARVADLRDVVTNTAGAFLGVLMARRHNLHDSDTARSPAAVPSGSHRRGARM